MRHEGLEEATATVTGYHSKNLIFKLLDVWMNRKPPTTAPKTNVLNPKVCGVYRCFSFSKGVFSGSILEI